MYGAPTKDVVNREDLMPGHWKCSCGYSILSLIRKTQFQQWICYRYLGMAGLATQLVVRYRQYVEMFSNLKLKVNLMFD